MATARALLGVLAGMVLGFAQRSGEFGATITFVSNIPRRETQTISSAIYSLIQTSRWRHRAAGRAGDHFQWCRWPRADRRGCWLRGALPRGYTAAAMPRVDISKLLGVCSRSAGVVREREEGRGHRPLPGASGSGKTSLINMPPTSPDCREFDRGEGNGDRRLRSSTTSRGRYPRPSLYRRRIGCCSSA